MAMQIISLNRGVARRLSGPGGLYNLGNGLGLLGGLMFHVAAAMAPAGTGLSHGASAVVDYLAGSAGAFALTLAMLVFFWSGERYHRAWANGAPPDAAMNRIGDASSGWGALLLGLGLFLMGQPLLAATSGLLHAAGKFGSTLPAHVQARLPFGPNLYRLTVVASRLPALVAVLLQAQAALAEGIMQPLAAAGLLFLCYILWLKADLALLRG